MRSLKKLLAVIVAICVLATFTIPAFAADSATYANADQATKLNSMGLYAGISTTSFDPDLGSTLTREQGMVILLKMFGQLDAANAMTDADTDAALAAYTDASTLSSWAKKAFAYVVKNSISSGTSATTLDPKGTFTGNQFATLILKEAGFTVADWTTAAADLTTKGVAGAGALATTVLTRDNLVGMAFGALTVNNAAGKTIVAALVEAGKVTAASAIAAGVYTDAVTATAAVTGAKKITVTFNQAIDTTKATFVVKRGPTTLSSASVTFAADKKSADLTMAAKFIAGDYTVAVKGLTTTDISLSIAGVKDETESKIELSSATAAAVKDGSFNITGATIGYKVLNQYGENITSDGATSSVTWTPSIGSADDNNDGTVTLTAPASYYTLGQSIVLTGVITDAGVVTTNTIAIGASAALDAITFDKVYNADDKTLATDSTYEDFYLLFASAKDQYGNDMGKAALNADLVVSSSNPSVASIPAANPIDDNYGPDSDKLGIQLVTPAVAIDGTTTIRMISKTSGKMFSFDITVAKKSTVDNVTLQAPADAVATGETVDIPFTAVDQAGKTVTDYTELTTDITTSGPAASLDWAHDYVKNTAVLKFTAPATKGSYIIMAMTKAGKVSQLTIDVKEAAAPSVVVGVTSDVVKNLAVGASETVKYAFINVHDQYDRSFDMTKAGYFPAAPAVPVDGEYRIFVKKDSATNTKVTVTGTDADGAGFAIYEKSDDNTVTLTGNTKGSSTIDFVLQKYDADAVDALGAPDPRYIDVPGSQFNLTVGVVDVAGIASYTMDDPGTMFDQSAAGVTTAPAGDYSKDVNVYGVKADGSKVKMDKSQYTVDTDNANLTYDYATNKLIADGVLASGDDDTTATVVVTVAADGVPQTVVQPVKVSIKAPKAATVALDTDYDDATGKYEEAGLVSVILPADVTTFTATQLIAAVQNAVKITDQYGQTLPDTLITKVFVTNLDSARHINADDGVDAVDTNLVAADTFNVTVVINGKSLIFKVVCKV